jgi:hypothetical protein
MEVKRSIITVIKSNSPSQFLDKGSGPTKSIPMDSQGREGMVKELSLTVACAINL